MLSSIDLLLVNSPGKDRVYQSLADDLIAFEPPIWAALIAEFARKKNYRVEILDAEALQLSYEETVNRIKEKSPLLTVFVVYGQQPSASTQSMPAAIDVHKLLKAKTPKLQTMFLGTHSAALPELTLKETRANFVCYGEGPLSIEQTLIQLKSATPNFSQISGIWYWDEFSKPCGNAMTENIKDLDEAMPGMAWDLLPMEKYKAHNWHCWDHINDRQPYASLYTSLGCPFKCSFCCINAPFGRSGIRYFSVEWTIRQLDILVNDYGVKNIKFADEMFVLQPSRLLDICDHIIEKGYDLNIWAYARVDTVKDKFLAKLKQAGFNWLGLGIESGNKNVRSGVDKGRFVDLDIAAIIKKIQDAGIYVGANYIFGLPNDTFESMQETLDMALELNTEWANFYSAMAYPGSPLHQTAVNDKVALPEDEGGPGWIGYSQHSYECLPLPTKTLKAEEVLTFRDYAFDVYFNNPKYIEMMKNKFGDDVVKHLEFMTSHSLKRKNTLPRSDFPDVFTHIIGK